MRKVYAGLATTDEIVGNCYWGFRKELGNNPAEFFAPLRILENVLYNLGYMYTDIMEIISTPDTDPLYGTYWSYFVGVNSGDFLIRFLYYDPN